MRAVIVPEAKARLELPERPVPDPRCGEVLVRIHAYGICGSDLPYRSGRENTCAL
ncbi:alcohol dehydrogenase catalytic domain-containing protein [Nonomuraea sp. NPDC049784]|uniref:alcohol dehydrogenase catalytic domain-containing protein n=1 Tax=Nonomuraea sp. NPDC049784 TaxID=3154361 RepID=UPI00340EBFDF